MNYDFNPNPIQILLDTNIPNKSAIPLTRSILYMKNITSNISLLEEYPLFIETFKFPRNYLYKTSYENRINFFFSKMFFNKKMNYFYPNEGIKYNEKMRNSFKIGGNTEDDELISNYPEIKITNDLVEYNIITLLTALFPMSYPITNNIRTSYNMKITKNMDLDFKLNDLIPKPLQRLLNSAIFETDIQPVYYSYLNIDGKIHTVTDIIWLNDFYNNKKYSNIFTKYNELRIWQERQKVILTNEIDRKKKIFSNKYVIDGVIFKNKGNDAKTNELKIIEDIIEKYNDLLNQSNKSDNAYQLYSNRDKIRMYNNIINDFNIIKTEMENINTNVNNIQELNSSVDNLQILFEKIRNQITIDNNMKMLIEKIRKIKIYVGELFQLEYINDTYFNSTYINFEFLDDTIVSKEMKERFKKYTEFIILVQGFSILSKRSTNKLLQNSIELFLDKINEKKLIYLLQPNFLKEKEPIKYFKEYLNTGVMYDSKDNMYKIEIRIDLIDGEINDENRSTIKCTYTGEKLTQGAINIWENKVPFWKLPNVRMLYETNTNNAIFTNYKIDYANINKENDNDNDNTSDIIENNPEKKGGKSYKSNRMKHTRKLKSALIRTMKHYK